MHYYVFIIFYCSALQNIIKKWEFMSANKGRNRIMFSCLLLITNLHTEENHNMLVFYRYEVKTYMYILLKVKVLEHGIWDSDEANQSWEADLGLELTNILLMMQQAESLCSRMLGKHCLLFNFKNIRLESSKIKGTFLLTIPQIQI